MTPPPPKKPLRNTLRRGINRVRDAISPASRPSSPHPPYREYTSDAPGAVQDRSQDSILSTPQPSSTLSVANSVDETLSMVGNQTQDAILPMSLASSQKSLSHSEPETSNKLKKAFGVAWSGLETALRLLEKSADAFPPLRSAVGGLVACLDLAKAVIENHEEYEKLVTEFTIMANTLAPYITKLATCTGDDSGSIACIIESIKAEVTHLSQQQDRNNMIRTIEANQDQGDVIQRYRRVESLFRQLQNDISLRTWENTTKLQEMALFKEMAPVDDARYNSRYSMAVKRHGCTPETREKILKDIQNWAEDSNGAKVYWINSMAGTGKTTILYSLCELLAKKQQLGGNYFCSRMSSSCRDVNNIVPTLAYQLAQYSTAFRSALCKILEQNPEASALDVRWQFQKLLQEPMEAVKSALPEGVVIVIDALDECDDGEAFRLFLETLLKLAADLPVKFFLTSRPEPVIREKMLSPEYSHSVLRLDNIEELIAQVDIKKYLVAALGSMSLPLPDDGEHQTYAPCYHTAQSSCDKRLHLSCTIMSGCQIRSYESDGPLHTLSYNEHSHVSQDIKSDIPNIVDRSKNDPLLTARAIIQTSWFVNQFMARMAEKMVIKEIEVITMALATLNIIMNLFWWTNIRNAIPVH